jgi:hypothetical protein
MMRRKQAWVMCGLLAAGIGWAAGVGRSEADPMGSPGAFEAATTRPVDQGPAASMPADAERWLDERGGGGGGQGRMDTGRRGPDRPGWGSRQPGPPEHGRGGPEDHSFTPKEREELVEFVRQHFPEMHGRLQRFQRADPGRYGQALRRLEFPMLRMMHLSKTDPQLAEAMIAEHRVEIELADWQDRYPKQTSEQARADIRSRIRELVGRRFDLRQRRLEMEIRNMQKRLDEAQARLSQQAADRSRMVDAEVQRIVGRLEKERPGEADSKSPAGKASHAFPQGAPPGHR